jgi:hypothetical protein
MGCLGSLERTGVITWGNGLFWDFGKGDLWHGFAYQCQIKSFPSDFHPDYNFLEEQVCKKPINI